MRDDLLALYDDLGADIAKTAPVCDLSGRCCRFKEYGHTLFLSRPEASILLEQGLPENAVVDEASCPFQIKGLCTARERRPLGCRVYFCDPTYAGVGESLTERYLTRLKQLHDEAEMPWDYRRLHCFLEEHTEAETANRPI